MALTLPSSPSDGQQVTYENTRFTFSSAKNVWTREMLSGKFEQIVPTSNTSLVSTAIVDNKLVLTQADGSSSNVNLQAIAAGSLSVYANESDLPSTGVQPGDHAFVSATNDLYIRTASQWRNIDAVNLTPTVSLSVSSHTFANEGETIDVTYTTNEPEGTPITITVANTGLVSTNEATITHHASNNTVTILAGNTFFNGAVIAVAASDGVNIGTGSLNLDFAASWSSATLTTRFDDQESNQNYARTCALAGDYAAVAAPSLYASQYGGSVRSGGVFIHRRVGTSPTGWSGETLASQYPTGGGWPETTLIADGTGYPNATQNDNLGIALKFKDGNGDELLIGQGNTGSPYKHNLYRYTRSGNNWSLAETIAAPSAGTTSGQMQASGTTHRFLAGNSLDWNGNYFVVGAHDDGAQGHSNSKTGSAWVYHTQGGNYSIQQELNGIDTTDNDSFGEAVSIEGSIVAVGAPQKNQYSGGSGAVYIFQRSGTTWTQIQKIEPPTSGVYYNSNHTTHRYGRALSLDGNYLAISGASTTINGTANIGSIHIYQWDGSSYVIEAVVTASDGGGGHYFGESLQLRDNVLAVGAYGASQGYVFTRSGVTWTEDIILAPGNSPYNSSGLGTLGTLALNLDSTKNELLIGAPSRGAWLWSIP